MPMYRKKPVVIEAREWTGANAVDLLAWIGPGSRQDGQTLVIPTLEGDHEASLGDMIIQGIKGEFYPCKPDIFVATYETADTPAPAPADDGWTKWKGGECPVHGGLLVDVRRRDGYVETGLSARFWRWDHRGVANDIVAYRIVGARDG